MQTVSMFAASSSLASSSNVLITLLIKQDNKVFPDILLINNIQQVHHNYNKYQQKISARRLDLSIIVNLNKTGPINIDHDTLSKSELLFRIIMASTKDFSSLERAARSFKVLIINNTSLKLVKRKEDLVHGQVRIS